MHDEAAPGADDRASGEELVTVYKYGDRRFPTGQPGRSGRPATAAPELDEATLGQVLLAHRMRNALVDLEYQYDAAVAEVWGEYPQIAAADTALAGLVARKDDLLAQMKTQQQQRRSRDKVDADLRAAIAETRKGLKAGKEVRKQLKDALYPQIKHRLEEVSARRNDLRKAIRQHYAGLGLYWGTYNRVSQHHQTADKLVRQKRRDGQPADHRFHRWDGTGTVTVQLQRQAGDPPRSPATLATGDGPWAGQVQINPWVPPDGWETMTRAQRRAAGRGELRMRTTGRDHGNNTAVVPIQVHRMLPVDADVTGVQLTRRTVAGSPVLSAAVTAKIPAPAVRDDGPVAAVHVGWRVRGDGSLRVATIVSTADLTPPGSLGDVVVCHGRWAEVVLPGTWRDSHHRYEQIRSGRDKDLDRIKERLAGWLDEHGPLDLDGLREPVTAAMVRRWRSPGRVATVTLALRGTGHELEAELEAWRVQDKHLWTWESNGRLKLARRRTDAWRRVAAWLAGGHRLVVTDDIDIADLARSREDDDAQIEAARANRVVAAPGELREAVRRAAPTHGAATVVAQASGGNRHYRCGSTTAVPDDYASRTVVWCDRCRRGFDQDHNMCLMLLAASGEVAPPPGGTARGTVPAGG